MANISSIVTQIRQAILGKDVRKSIADGIDSINNEVTSTTSRQQVIEDKFQDQLALTNFNTANLFKNPMFYENRISDWSLGAAASLDTLNKIETFNTIKIVRSESMNIYNMFYQSMKNLANDKTYFVSIKYKLGGTTSKTLRIVVYKCKNGAIINTTTVATASVASGISEISGVFTTESQYDEYRITFALDTIGEVWFTNPLLLLNSDSIKTFSMIEETFNRISLTKFNPNNINTDKGSPEGWYGIYGTYASYSNELLDGFKTVKIRIEEGMESPVNPYKVCIPPNVPYSGKISSRMKVKVVADNPSVYPLVVTAMILSYPQAEIISGTAVSELKDYTITEDGVYDIAVIQDIDLCYRIHAAIRVRTRAVNFYVNQLTVTLSDYPEANNLSGLYKESKKEVAEKEELLTILNPLYKKKALYNGDSIGQALNGNGGYARQIAERNNMTLTNYCIGGGTIAAETYTTDGVTPRHWVSRSIATMSNDADYIILEGGINDYSIGVPVGEITPNYNSALDDTTFCGALESMFKQAQLKWKGKKIGFIITHKINSTFYPYGNSVSGKFEVYRQKIIESCEKWSIPYLDLFNISGLNSNLPDIKNMYFYNNDGTHPNELGYLLFYTPKIEAWMKTL